MRFSRFVAPAAAGVAMLVIGQAAYGELLVDIDKSAQRMTVTRDGEKLYVWPVATGGIDYDTPNGKFRPFRMEIDHYSDEWDNAPMPYSIFFTETGNAIHGTYERRSLGHAVSHGCVRLSVQNAATLWKLVKQEKMANTTVLLHGTIPGGIPDSEPAPVAEDDPGYGLQAPLDLRRYLERPQPP
jgi:lipoprotein-anchoring transpeptidase ErfK/SrfK